MKYTKKQRDSYANKKAFLAALDANGGFIERACATAGVTRTTVFRWKRTDQDFCDEFESIRDATASIVETALMKRIAEGDTTAIMYYLNNKGQGLGYNKKEAQFTVNFKPIDPDLNKWAAAMDDAFTGGQKSECTDSSNT